MTASTDLRYGGPYRGPSDRIMSRNQKEAGIDRFEWEGRIKPRWSWSQILVVAVGAMICTAMVLAIGDQGIQIAHATGWLK